MLGAVSLGSLVALAPWLADGGSGFAKAIVAALGAAGLSLAGLQGRLKNATQALVRRLRQDAYADLVATAVTVVPPRRRRTRLRVTTTTECAVAKSVRRCQADPAKPPSR